MRVRVHIKRGLLTAAVALLICALLSVSLFAWFSLQKPSDGAFGFAASGLSNVTLEMSRLASGRQESERTFAACDPTPETNAFGWVAPTAENGRYTVLLENMTFGSIDNLSRLKGENKVYFCLKVPAGLGQNVTVDFYHASADFFELYKNLFGADGQPTGEQELVTDAEMIGRLNAVIDPPDTTAADQATGETAAAEVGQFLQYSCAFSSAYIAAADIEAAIAETDASKPQLHFGAPTQVKVREAGDTAVVQTCPDEVYEGATDFYYVYILLSPNLNVYAKSVEHLATIMPCFMFFDVTLMIDIR